MNVSDVDKIMGIMARLNDYVALVTDLNADYWTRMGFTHKPAPVASIDSIGKRYAKIIVGGNTVHSFIDMDNGDILKGTWKAPIRTPKKGLAVRGNIFSDDVGKSNINNHGPKYLK
jgi:hypothetical protein